MMAQQFTGAEGRKQLWDEFRGDAELITRHRITHQEIELLRSMVLVGKFTEKRDLLAALRKLRHGGCH
jgi:hypothetical protein